MQPNDFWPFAEYVMCARCHQPVRTRDAVAVVGGENLAGMAHTTCP
jgi:hypothetical protein